MAGGDIFRFVTWSLTIPIVLFYVLSLVGCISNSPGVPDIFLLKLQDTKTLAEVRVGYFGMCAATVAAGGTIPSPLACQPSFSVNRAAAESTPSTAGGVFDSTDPVLLRLVDLGHEVQTKVIFFVPLLLASVLFFVSTFLIVLWRNIPKLSPMAATVSFVMHNLALGLLLAAATAVSMVINALHFAVLELTGGSSREIAISGGLALQTFQWLTVVFSLAWQVCVMKRYRSDVAGGKA